MAQAAGLLVVLLGLLVLAGWALGIQRLTSVLPDLATTKANTALALALCGASLALLAHPRTGHRRIAAAPAVLAAVLAAATLAQYVFGMDLGIDQLLLKDTQTSDGAPPGRMAPATATGILLVATAIALLGRQSRLGPPSQYLAGASAFLSLVAVVGYAYDVESLDAVAVYATVALHTALGLLVLSLGVFAARPRDGATAIVLSDGPGGRAARPLLAAAVFLPFVLGLLRLAGERTGWYETAFGTSVMVVANALVMMVLVVRAAGRLDTTDAWRGRAEEALRSLTQRQEQVIDARTTQLVTANKELESFAYSVSHDLRAPLRAMDGFARILAEEHASRLDDDARHCIEMIVDSAREMEELVEDLLALSRLGRQALRRERVDPAAVARRALEDLAPEAKGRDIEVRVGDLPPCEADPGLLRQVYANLLGNALKYTRKREHAVVEVGWTPEAGGAYLVRDNGVGFDMRHAGTLFGVFQRLHRADEYEGTGVGLAIVARIVARHGGRVWAEAEVDRGATFYFTIPGGPDHA